MKLLMITMLIVLTGCQTSKSVVSHLAVEGLADQEYKKGAFCLQLRQQCRAGAYQEWESETGALRCTCDGAQDGQGFIHPQH